MRFNFLSFVCRKVPVRKQLGRLSSRGGIGRSRSKVEINSALCVRLKILFSFLFLLGYGAGAKSDSQNVASRQQAITTAYDKLLTAAQVCM